MLTGKNRILCFDTENIGFVEDIRAKNHMHIIQCIDAKTREKFWFFDNFEDRVNAVHLGPTEGLRSGTIEDGVRFLSEAKCLIIQNGNGYDFHVFEKVYPEYFKGFDYFAQTGDPEFPFKVMDTHTMSCTLNPEREAPYEARLLGKGNVGPHSIEAHGIRIGRYKPEHEDWSHLSLDMFTRVEEDTEIGLDFYYWLMREWRQQLANPNPRTKYTIMDAYYCESRVAQTMARQALRGFRFDMGFASELLAELDAELSTTEKAIRPHIPLTLDMTTAKWSASQMASQAEHLTKPQIVELRRVSHISSRTTVWSLTNKATKNGTPISKAVTSDFPEVMGYKEVYGDNWEKSIVGGPYTPLVWKEVPLGNRAAMKVMLYDYGWRGVNLNDTELEHYEKYHKLFEKGGKHRSKAIEMGELPSPWAGKIDEDSVEKWVKDGNPPEWALGIARWYILRSRRTQILNIDDPINYRLKGQWTNHAGRGRKCRGILPTAICQDTRMTAQSYFEKYNMWPDSGHWRVPASAFHAATNTFRMRHKVVVNIPSRGLYGKEMRKLFIAMRGKKIIGCDGAGLELRMLAHFMGDHEYTDIILNGDIHTYNQGKANLPERDMAKTFIYAFLYGSGIPNLARVCGVSETTMRACIDAFKASLPSLDRLITGVQNSGERGFLSAIDGRWCRIRKRDGEYALHTALNVLLQSTGSIIMKWAHVLAEDMALEKGLINTLGEFPQLCHMHDESQMEDWDDNNHYIGYTIDKSEWKAEEKAEYHDELGQWSAPMVVHNSGNTMYIVRIFNQYGDIYSKAITMAGEKFGLRCPTAGEYKVGDSWLDTH